MAGWPHDEEQNALTPAEQQLHRHLLADGAAWRRRAEPTLPSPGAFVSRAQQRLDRERAQSSAVSPTDAMVTPDALNHHDTHTLTEYTEHSRVGLPANRPVETQRADSPKGLYRMSSTQTIPPPATPHPARRRFAGGLAGAVALVIVALLAATLAYALHTRQNTSAATTHHTAKATPTVAPTALPTQPPAPTSVRTPYNQPGGFEIAPSDPQIVYLTTYANYSNPQSGVILRSNDGGRTFTQLPTPPTILGSGTQFTVAVSPLDANHVFAMVTNSPLVIGTNCPPGTASENRADGATGYSQLTELSAPSCLQSFYSLDGGQSWSVLNLPYGGGLGNAESSSQVDIGTIQAQGSRLYALGGLGFNSRYTNNIIQHLLTSADGGASWQVADAKLPGSICDFAATPTGSTLYAVVYPGFASFNGNCGGNMSGLVLSLWRSDNAGVSWGKMYTFSDLTKTAEYGMRVAENGTLYIDWPESPPTGNPATVNELIVSQDDGHSFTRLPLKGLSAHYNNLYLAGTLSDGSVLIADQVNPINFGQGQGEFYAWRPGDTSLRKVSRLFPNPAVAVVVIPHDAKDTIYLVQYNGVISHFTISA